ELLGPRDVEVRERSRTHLVEREQKALTLADEVPWVLIRGIRTLDVGLDEFDEQLPLARLERIDEPDLATFHAALVVRHSGLGGALVAVAGELAPLACDLDGVVVDAPLPRLAVATWIDGAHGPLRLDLPEFVEEVLHDEAQVAPVADHGPP